MRTVDYPKTMTFRCTDDLHKTVTAQGGGPFIRRALNDFIQREIPEPQPSRAARGRSRGRALDTRKTRR